MYCNQKRAIHITIPKYFTYVLWPEALITQSLGYQSDTKPELPTFDFWNLKLLDLQVCLDVQLPAGELNALDNVFEELLLGRLGSRAGHLQVDRRVQVAAHLLSPRTRHSHLTSKQEVPRSTSISIYLLYSVFVCKYSYTILSFGDQILVSFDLGCRIICQYYNK